tara:strand:- start:9 stop:575 length:567 start_codon:yes stop_codon:yes gene_type:complete
MENKIKRQYILVLSFAALVVSLLSWMIYDGHASKEERKIAYYSVKQNLVLFEKGSNILNNQYRYFQENENILDLNRFFEIEKDDLLNKNLAKAKSFYYLKDGETLFFIGPESYIDKEGGVIKFNGDARNNAMRYFENALLSKDKDLNKNIIGEIKDGNFMSLRGEYKKQFDDEVLSELEERIVIIIRK